MSVAVLYRICRDLGRRPVVQFFVVGRYAGCLPTRELGRGGAMAQRKHVRWLSGNYAVWGQVSIRDRLAIVMIARDECIDAGMTT